ncbi:MAG TPA: VanW family protein [Acidimicrobiales bacterium]|jgi:vancomycin resistance protein YoaR
MTHDGIAVTTELPVVDAPPAPEPETKPTSRTFAVRTPAPPAPEPTQAFPTEPRRRPSPYATSTPPSQARTRSFAPPDDTERPRNGTGDGQPLPPPRHMRPATAGRADRTVESRDVLSRIRSLPKPLIALVPLVVLLVMVVAWTVDSTVLSGQVPRNVELAGRSIGGLGEDDLPKVMSDLTEEVAARPVTIRSEGKEYKTTAASLGLALDEDRTTEAALDVGHDDSFFVRPFKWIASFFSAREVSLQYTVTETQTLVALSELQGADLTPPVEPTIALYGSSFVLVPGQPGVGISPDQVVKALPDAAGKTEGSHDPITIDVNKSDVPPRFTDQDAQALADRANNMTAPGLTLQADGTTATLSAEQLRAWITPTTTDAGQLDLVFDGVAAKATLPGLFGELGGEAVNATVKIENGQPVVKPGHNGVVCCGEDADALIWNALTNGQTTVELTASISEPEFTTQEVEGWGIVQPIGGSRGWQNGSAIDGPSPGFTTYHAAGEPRVTNIHRIADLVDGAVIEPGGEFSVNDHVGQRTTANGFVEAGAIRNGVHVPEIGGGVSQFATTLFNAAYFAGLDITRYQSHTEYFARYPRGREATMGYPTPDLVFVNNTPYGILIDTSYTSSSLTVTLWSTPYITAEQTNISETASGACTVVTTTRTRSYPDGTTKNDNFRATYRPGEGLFCQ